jgi:biotin-dependent carboxylase-like uncharacterized protein
VPAGSLVEVGRHPGALRCWLAVGGGIEVPETLGSRSTDTMSGLGPPPVRTGDTLPVGAGSPGGFDGGEAVPPPEPGRPVAVRLRAGPRDDWFEEGSIAALLREEYEVSASSDRVGVRLRGTALVRRVAGELPSEGVVTGAVQVPGDGRPLIFLADHPTTGGYPVVGVVPRDDLAVCAQLRPGDVVRFVAAR